MKVNVLLKNVFGQYHGKVSYATLWEFISLLLCIINVPAEYFILIGQLHQISMFYSVLFFFYYCASHMSHKIKTNIIYSNCIIRLLDNSISKLISKLVSLLRLEK